MTILVLSIMKNEQIRKSQEGEIITQYIKTTTGRAILNYIIQKTLNLE
jgi:hypothetical protein